MAPYAGVDLGASTVSVLVGDAPGAQRGRATRATPDGPTGTSVTEAVLETARAACADAGVDPASVDGVGVGAIGPLDRTAGVVRGPANVGGVETIPLVGPLEALFDAPVSLQADTTAALFGERRARDAPGDVVYLTISSGIGAGVAVDGHVLRGRSGNAGEVGHVTVDPRGAMRCGCGRDGHWEAYCSGENVPRYAAHLHREDPVETALPLGSGDLDAAAVYRAAAAGDAFATGVVDRVNRWNVQGVATVVHAYDPAEVVLGGAVVHNNPAAVVGPLRERLPGAVLTGAPTVRRPVHGADAVLAGALAVAFENWPGP